MCNDADTDATPFGIRCHWTSVPASHHRRRRRQSCIGANDVIEASGERRDPTPLHRDLRCDAAQARTVLRTFENRIDTSMDPDRPQRWAAAQLTGSCRCVLSGLESPAGNVFDHEMLC